MTDEKILYTMKIEKKRKIDWEQKAKENGFQVLSGFIRRCVDIICKYPDLISPDSLMKFKDEQIEKLREDLEKSNETELVKLKKLEDQNNELIRRNSELIYMVRQLLKHQDIEYDEEHLGRAPWDL